MSTNHTTTNANTPSIGDPNWPITDDTSDIDVLRHLSLLATSTTQELAAVPQDLREDILQRSRALLKAYASRAIELESVPEGETPEQAQERIKERAQAGSKTDQLQAVRQRLSSAWESDDKAKAKKSATGDGSVDSLLEKFKRRGPRYCLAGETKNSHNAPLPYLVALFSFILDAKRSHPDVAEVLHTASEFVGETHLKGVLAGAESPMTIPQAVRLVGKALQSAEASDMSSLLHSWTHARHREGKTVKEYIEAVANYLILVDDAPHLGNPAHLALVYTKPVKLEIFRTLEALPTANQVALVEMMDDPTKSIFDMARGLEQARIVRSKGKPESKPEHQSKTDLDSYKPGKQARFASNDGGKHYVHGRGSAHHQRDNNGKGHDGGAREQQRRPRPTSQNEFETHHAERGWSSPRPRSRTRSPSLRPVSHSRDCDHDCRSLSPSRSRSHSRSGDGPSSYRPRSRSRDRVHTSRHDSSRLAVDERNTYFTERSRYHDDMARLASRAQALPSITQREPCALCAVNKHGKTHVAATHDVYGCRDRADWLKFVTLKIVAGLSLLRSDELPKVDDMTDKVLDRLARLFDSKHRAVRDSQAMAVFQSARTAAENWRAVYACDKTRFSDQTFRTFVENSEYKQYFAPARQRLD